jgi:hypothetical protein
MNKAKLNFTAKELIDIEVNTNFILPRSGANQRMLKKAHNYRTEQRHNSTRVIAKDTQQEPVKELNSSKQNNFFFSDLAPAISYNNTTLMDRHHST